MFECPLEPNNVFFVVGVCLLQLVENLNLFLACPIPRPLLATVEYSGATDLHGLLTTDDLDGHLLTRFTDLPIEHTRFHNIGEHALAEGREDLVTATIKLLTQDDLVVTFGVCGGV